jgi:hypothetical protein
MKLNILQTRCGPLTMACATCCHSTFLRGNLQACELQGGKVMDEDDCCPEWQPLVVAGPDHFFGLDHGQLEEA